MGSFLKSASKKVTDIRTFIKDSSKADSLRYRVEKGAKHFLYFPYREVEVMDPDTNELKVVREPIAISGNVHEWEGNDGKFYSTVCTKDVHLVDDNGNVINDGSCKICDRVQDAWDIYNYRYAEEEARSKKNFTNDKDRETHLDSSKKNFLSARKAKEANPYLYILVVLYKTNGKEPVIEDGLPQYDLKVMRASANRIEKIREQISNSGVELEGAELVFQYADVDDPRLQVSQSTVAVLYQNGFLDRYPQLKEKIQKEVEEFEFDGLEKHFKEWQGMSTAEQKSVMDSLFSNWDEYKIELKHNPDKAKYLEYTYAVPQEQPSLDSGTNKGSGNLLGSGDIPDPNSLFGNASILDLS